VNGGESGSTVSRRFRVYSFLDKTAILWSLTVEATFQSGASPILQHQIELGRARSAGDR